MAIEYDKLALSKGEPRARTKRRRKREERARVYEVRPDVERRDGYCRLTVGSAVQTSEIIRLFGACRGRSEWAHFGDKKRYKTRGMAPEQRHTTQGSLMLCEHHHDLYDHGPMDIEAQDAAAGCDGALTFAVPAGSWSEAA